MVVEGEVLDVDPGLGGPVGPIETPNSDKLATVVANGHVPGGGPESVSVVDPTARVDNVSPVSLEVKSGTAFDSGGASCSLKTSLFVTANETATIGR